MHNYLYSMRKRIIATNMMFDNNKEDIIIDNRSLLNFWSVTIIVIYIFLYLNTFLIESYSDLRPHYAYILVALIVIKAFYNFYGKKISPCVGLYSYFYFTSLFAMYMSVIVCKYEINVIILAVVVMLPIVILDKSIYTDSADILIAAAYLIFVYFFKSPNIAEDEIVNVIFFTFIGIIMGRHSKFIKLTNFELKRQALLDKYIDPLTSLPNRRKMFEELYKNEAYNPDEKVMAILMIDIDKFKLFNDNYGHQAGDNCLERIGECFLNFGAKYDLSFYRYGGEEFIAFSHVNEIEALKKIGSDLNWAIYNLKIPHELSEFKFVTVSIGFSFWQDGEENTNYEKLISKADSALYIAKNSGRNQTAGFGDY